MHWPCRCNRQVDRHACCSQSFDDRCRLFILDPTEKGVPNTILVLLCAQFNNGKYTPAQRELIIGCALVTSGPKKVLAWRADTDRSSYSIRMATTRSIIWKISMPKVSMSIIQKWVLIGYGSLFERFFCRRRWKWVLKNQWKSLGHRRATSM